MRNDRLFVEVELLVAAEMPVLSHGLRARVLSAAIETSRRRAYGRRALRVTVVLVAFVGLTAWRGPLAFVTDGLAGFGAAAATAAEDPYAGSVQLLNVSRRYGRGELLFSAAGDDWRLVEAELESRHEGYRHIRMSF